MSTKVTRQKTKQGMKEDMLFHAHVYSILYLFYIHLLPLSVTFSLLKIPLGTLVGQVWLLATNTYKNISY